MATHIRLIPSQEWFERPDQLDRIKIWCLWMGCPYSFLTSWDQVVTTNRRGDWAGSGFAARRLFLSQAERYLAGAQQAIPAKAGRFALEDVQNVDCRPPSNAGGLRGLFVP